MSVLRRDGGDGHWLVRMERRPAGWSVCLLCPFGEGGVGSPSNTRPTCMTSFILIHPTTWPQYTNVTDTTERQDRQTVQWSDSIGRTVLQTVAQKSVSIWQR